MRCKARIAGRRTWLLKSIQRSKITPRSFSWLNSSTIRPSNCSRGIGHGLRWRETVIALDLESSNWTRQASPPSQGQRRRLEFIAFQHPWQKGNVNSAGIEARNWKRFVCGRCSLREEMVKFSLQHDVVRY